MQQDSNQRVTYLDEKLRLTGKQRGVVNKKLTEYVIAEKTISAAEIVGKIKILKTQKLRQKNLKDMRDILHQRQYSRYGSRG